jgi:hypothetical protein
VPPASSHQGDLGGRVMAVKRAKPDAETFAPGSIRHSRALIESWLYLPRFLDLHYLART